MSLWGITVYRNLMGVWWLPAKEGLGMLEDSVYRECGRGKDRGRGVVIAGEGRVGGLEESV